jgi:hypothetical protein
VLVDGVSRDCVRSACYAPGEARLSCCAGAGLCVVDSNVEYNNSLAF